MITYGKKGTLPSWRRASGFVLKPDISHKLFTHLAPRYAERQGGYTRIHRFGRRPGDNAPHAILELVDNPKDLKFEMTARAVGWDLLSHNLKKSNPQHIISKGVPRIDKSIEEARVMKHEEKGTIRSLTRWNLQKTLKYRPESSVQVLAKKAEEHIVRASLLCTAHTSSYPRAEHIAGQAASKRPRAWYVEVPAGDPERHRRRVCS
jgi:large subunit ribosomal protein L17